MSEGEDGARFSIRRTCPGGLERVRSSKERRPILQRSLRHNRGGACSGEGLGGFIQEHYSTRSQGEDSFADFPYPQVPARSI